MILSRTEEILLKEAMYKESDIKFVDITLFRAWKEFQTTKELNEDFKGWLMSQLDQTNPKASEVKNQIQIVLDDFSATYHNNLGFEKFKQQVMQLSGI